jgi:hypothetical protein
MPVACLDHWRPDRRDEQTIVHAARRYPSTADIVKPEGPCAASEPRRPRWRGPTNSRRRGYDLTWPGTYDPRPGTLFR